MEDNCDSFFMDVDPREQSLERRMMLQVPVEMSAILISWLQDNQTQHTCGSCLGYRSKSTESSSATALLLLFQAWHVEVDATFPLQVYKSCVDLYHHNIDSRATRITNNILRSRPLSVVLLSLLEWLAFKAT